ncbi:protelomerase family protein [Enterovibrio norvegicus]|uniref:protelomerase family protein n=1 Tax=Enterovibrio norvegicus TaxID=188144 RepID=UPI003553AF51
MATTRKSKDQTAEIVKKIKHIQAESQSKDKGAGKYITDRCNKIARDVHTEFGVEVDSDTGELLSKPACSYRWYAQVMNKYRKAIQALGFKHHAIEYHVGAFIRKYQDKKPEVAELMNPDLPIEKLRENFLLLRAEMVNGSAMKRDLKELKFEHHAFYMFNPKGAVKSWIKQDSAARLNEKLNNMVLINPDWIKQKAHDLLVNKSSSTAELAIGLALATGRRVTEIMKTAKFNKVDDKTLMFEGQLKTRNRAIFEVVTPYRIPCMVEPEIVVKALQRLRKDSGKIGLSYKDVLGKEVKATISSGDLKDYPHNTAVQKYFTSTFNASIRSLLEDGRFTFKDTRAMYTEVTYDEHAKDGESRSAYRHRILGHSQIETQLHYDAFKVDSTVETVKFKADDQDVDQDKQKHLVEYLQKADDTVALYLRAPKIAIMHDWLKAEVENGLTLDKITPSYIRRYCLIEGKQINLNTVKKYLEEFVKLEQYEPPKAKKKKEKKEKPKGKKAREIFEIKERLEEIEDDKRDKESEHEDYEGEVEEREAQIEELKREIAEMKESMANISFEIEELESEEEDLQDRLAELEEEPDDEDQGDDETDDDDESPEEEKEAGGAPWPDVKTIKIGTRKSGDGYWAKATVNGEVFEVWSKGTRGNAIKALKDDYKEKTK